jgi:hypothetical protein
VRDTSLGVVAGESGGTVRAPAVSIIALAGSARFVYALIGRKPMDAMPSIGTEIVVSTWDGAPAQAIHLAYPIHSFAVSDDDQELFGSYFVSDNASPLIGHWHIGPTALSGAQTALTDDVAERRQCEAAASLKCSLLQAPDRTVKY